MATPPGYVPQGTFIIPQGEIARRRRLADVLALQGTETTPVQSPWQALARVAQAGAGAYGNYQAGQMEQQRYKAMGEAMRGGMTPEQMFGTGDPQMMQLGEFMIEQKRLQMQQDQQNAMFQQMAQTVEIHVGGVGQLHMLFAVARANGRAEWLFDNHVRRNPFRLRDEAGGDLRGSGPE
jgi:hypothetical protein